MILLVPEQVKPSHQHFFIANHLLVVSPELFFSVNYFKVVTHYLVVAIHRQLFLVHQHFFVANHLLVASPDCFFLAPYLIVPLRRLFELVPLLFFVKSSLVHCSAPSVTRHFVIWNTCVKIVNSKIFFFVKFPSCFVVFVNGNTVNAIFFVRLKL